MTISEIKDSRERVIQSISETYIVYFTVLKY
jgi:hypothetical protein